MKSRIHIRRWTLRVTLALLAVAALLVSRPAYLWMKAALRDSPATHDLPSGYVDDASRLNSTHVAEIASVPIDAAAAESQLRQLVKRAEAERKRIAIAGARHSMGGHTIFPDGIVLDMLPFNRMELHAANRILSVGAGARWSQIIPYLDAHDFSVGVMQSNNDFSVGGSISVNCHGWQHNHAPIASTVESFRLMKADGDIIRCSREENKELFDQVLGGYGLFGIILDVQLRVVPNERYRSEVEVLPAEEYVERFADKVNGADDVGMVYGRLCIVPGDDTFLREAILTVFRKAPCGPEEIPPMHSAAFASLRRSVYRAQIGSDAGKKVRWKAEKRLGERLINTFVSRNQLLSEEAEVYQDRNADRTDILHEYFIPPDGVNGFLNRAREIIPAHYGDLLNVTVRNVHEDTDTFLRYADQEMFGFVMLFNQSRTPNADSRMEAMTRELIDAALAAGGRYYLPYRLHATEAQFARAYPQAQQFFERKRHYDPKEIFQNQFYLKYAR